ncbi:hypothetical protein CCICO_08355 [Corynebacterium ciconiae DSM 44920]|uniref:hypothetical protein n=1 Tax=Corynebacterium ciconiae TaxID=227319 RepID=UPI000375D1C6|nr:hypothetical protein [Corynebacterium ciconiae]WKD61686.1 hypothetical protein CCICO_08355 [Corynebacterium ciconiae DSM 44920]
MSARPTFTDVQRRDIRVHTVIDHEVPVLAVDQILEDGSTKRLMLLNKFDSKQLAAACELYLQQIFSAAFSDLHHGLDPQEMAELFGAHDEEGE